MASPRTKKLAPVTKSLNTEIQCEFSDNLFSPNVAILGKYLTEWIEKGSKNKSINLQDVVVFKYMEPTGVANEVIERDPTTMRECLDSGTKFFDALIWMNLANKNDCPTVDQNDEHMSPLFNSDTGQHDDPLCARYITVVYFHLMSRANYPSGPGVAPGKDIPAFQKNILKCNVSGDVIKSALANFDLEQLDPTWIKYVEPMRISIELSNRLGLGVAGYRHLMPFKFYEPIPGLAPNLELARQAAKKIAMRDYNWAIHPLTRDPNFIQKFGAINANAMNLLLEVFSMDDIKKMKALQMIFAIPTHNERYIDYRSWNPADVEFTDGQIFNRDLPEN